jgi:hypothetical protein
MLSLHIKFRQQKNTFFLMTNIFFYNYMFLLKRFFIKSFLARVVFFMKTFVVFFHFFKVKSSEKNHFISNKGVF